LTHFLWNEVLQKTLLQLLQLLQLSVQLHHVV